ncbi:hypothetical protein HaLaN_22807 [Haematococcus lacustris]|uniref:Uncharacterized protein n=1 Tax=Haematococcus lacustris TaxID=44745 RepID=A0A699ZQ07_HAELA|nr:hypothetical protein HaLaN_22807 [Haematococcus lacustris]
MKQRTDVSCRGLSDGPCLTTGKLPASCCTDCKGQCHHLIVLPHRQRPMAYPPAEVAGSGSRRNMSLFAACFEVTVACCCTVLTEQPWQLPMPTVGLSRCPCSLPSLPFPYLSTPSCWANWMSGATSALAGTRPGCGGKDDQTNLQLRSRYSRSLSPRERLKLCGL